MFHEPDPLPNADADAVARELFPPAGSNEQEAAPLRFSLAELLVATTTAAVLLALFRTLGIFGALLSFAAALVFTLGIYPAMKPRDKSRQALMFDFVWGIVMPVVCVVFDPFVFKESEMTGLDFPLFVPAFGNLQPPAYFAYPAIALQITVMMAVLIVGRFPPAGAALLAGVLFCGMLVAGAIGVLLLPLSTIGLIVLIGMLGYTPLLTAWAFGRRAALLCQDAKPELSMPLQVLGFVAAAAVPGAIGWFCVTMVWP
jgi:hypothetical protein